MTFLILLFCTAIPASAEDSAVIPIADPVAALDRILAAQVENKARLTSAHVFWEIRQTQYADQGNKKDERLIEVELGFIDDRIGMRWKVGYLSLDGKDSEAKPEQAIYSAYGGNDFRVLLIENGRERLRIEDERDSQTDEVLPFREFRIRPELERLRAKFSDGKPSYDLIDMRTIEEKVQSSHPG